MAQFVQHNHQCQRCRNASSTFLARSTNNISNIGDNIASNATAAADNEATAITKSEQAKATKSRRVQQPHLTVRHSKNFFRVFGLLFVFVGLGVLLCVRSVDEILIDYTNCVERRHNNESNKTFCEDAISAGNEAANDDDGTCFCEIPFRVHEDIRLPVNLYYGLTNFYQNHRSYVLSKDERQLAGKLSQEDVATECTPYERNPLQRNNVIAPCGAIANSLFNDTISLYSVDRQSAVPLLKKNLIWRRIKNKFRNPPGNDLAAAFQNFSRPKAWRRNIWELDPTDPSNNGFENEDFIVWMQPATLSDFRKLYRRVDHNHHAYVNGLPKGDYQLRIGYAYPVTSFDGRKSVIISNSCAFGGKNTFLIYCCFTLATVCILISFIFGSFKRIRIVLRR